MTEQDILDSYRNGNSISQISQSTDQYTYYKIRKIILNSGLDIRGGRKRREYSEED